MDPTYILGFKTLAQLLGEGIVGQPLENERHNPENGDALQATTNGLLVWRKADNWTAFTDGYRTWVNGPYGLQERLNTERFPWERDRPEYRPQVLNIPLAPLSETYPFLATPKGFALHGTRSGNSRPARLEFAGAAGYEATRMDGCGANCTVGDDAVALHVPWSRWCWHARRASRYYISLELAQGTEADEITDAQVRAAAWVIGQCLEAHPAMPTVMRTHAELEHDGETGPNPITGRPDGKTDVFRFGDPRSEELRQRILARLKEVEDA